MLVRIITALVGIPIVIALVFHRGGLAFSIAIGIAAALAVLEFYRGMRMAGVRPRRIIGVLAALTLVHGAFRGNLLSAPAAYGGILTFLFILALVLELSGRRRPAAAVGATLLGAVYVGWLFSHLVAVRTQSGMLDVWVWRSETGAWLVMFTFLGTWACDTGAYFAGRFLGRRKLAPSISPGKTIEGSLGGFISSMLVATLSGIAIQFPVGHAVVLGGLIGIFGQLGDLAASGVKREMGIKDFGSILPGHGGVLDRFDSLLFTGPLVYYYVIAVLPNWPM